MLMANRIPNTDLDAFRRELEEDIRNFNADEAKKEVRKRETTSSSGHGSHSSHSHSSHSSSRSSSSYRSSSHRSSSSRSSSHRSSGSSYSSSSRSVSESHRSHGSSKKKKKSGKAFKVICIVLAIILLLAATAYGALHWELNRIGRHEENEVTKEEVRDTLDTEDKYGVGSADVDMVHDPNVTNILLIGQDRDPGQKAEMRSDAMIICSINEKTKDITLCSLMRDMYVPVPGYGYGMINHTYMIGGFDLLASTIEENFGIPIDGYVEVDFDRFMNLIDLLGGVNVVITSEEAEYINGKHSGWHLVSGSNKLTSEQALYYCRIRKNIGGDWGRTDRQRKVIMSAFNQLKSSGPKTMLNFAHDAMPSLTTNITNTKLIKYAYALASYSMDSDRSYRIPKEGLYTQEVREETLHVLIPDIKANAKEIQKYLYDY